MDNDISSLKNALMGQGLGPDFVMHFTSPDKLKPNKFFHFCYCFGHPNKGPGNLVWCFLDWFKKSISSGLSFTPKTSNPSPRCKRV